MKTPALEQVLAASQQIVVKQFRHQGHDVMIVKTSGYMGDRYSFVIDGTPYNKEGTGWNSAADAYEAARSELTQDIRLSASVSDDMLNSYLTTALWSSMDEADEQGGDPMDKNYDIEDIDPETVAKARKDLEAFVEKAGPLLDGLDMELVAHDFWLTRNRHGAGFWDGDYEKEIGEKLTDLSHEFGEVDLYVGDDSKIYSSVLATHPGALIGEPPPPSSEKERFERIDRVLEQMKNPEISEEKKAHLDKVLDGLNNPFLLKLRPWYVLRVGTDLGAWDHKYPFHTQGQPLAASQDVYKLKKVGDAFRHQDERGRNYHIDSLKSDQIELYRYFNSPGFRELILKGL